MRGETSYVRWFVAENHRELPTVRVLANASVCQYHAPVIQAAAGDRLRTTFLMLIREERRRLSSHYGRRFRRGGYAAPSAPCPVCDAGTKAAEVISLRLENELETPLGKVAYVEGGGLCRTHLATFCARARKEVAEWIRRDAERRLVLLERRLRASLAQPEYAAQTDPDAWMDALRFFWGDRTAAG
jgi:predicted Fe-S protein YdhL (DUF1289 family)